jgi:hypothetical protein
VEAQEQGGILSKLKEIIISIIKDLQEMMMICKQKIWKA